MGETTQTRGAARCRECGRAFAVLLDGSTVRYPIGSTDGCPCGSTEFDVVGDPTS